MSNNNNEVKSSFQIDNIYGREWTAKFNELCYEVFYKNDKGAQLLIHLENRYFRSPVASPAQEPSWAYFKEGMNEMIRSFTMGIHSHMALQQAKTNAKPLPRRARIKPIQP